MKREPVIEQPAIILELLQRHRATSFISKPAPIAAETKKEIRRRLNWAARDIAIRKRRDEIARRAAL